MRRHASRGSQACFRPRARSVESLVRIVRLFEKFTVIPAIDLKGGEVVRLLHGDMSKATVYGADPGETARRFEEAGAEVIHIVDLDGAIAGTPRNVDAIARIRASVKCAIDVSGGLRTIEAVRATFLKRRRPRLDRFGRAAEPRAAPPGLRRVPGTSFWLDRYSRRQACCQRMGRDQPTDSCRSGRPFPGRGCRGLDRYRHCSRRRAGRRRSRHAWKKSPRRCESR